MSSEETPKRKSSLGWILCAAAMVVVFLLGMLAASINERKAEVASIYNNKKIELTQTNANGTEYTDYLMTRRGLGDPFGKAGDGSPAPWVGGGRTLRPRI